MEGGINGHFGEGDQPSGTGDHSSLVSLLSLPDLVLVGTPTQMGRLDWACSVSGGLEPLLRILSGREVVAEKAWPAA